MSLSELHRVEIVDSLKNCHFDNFNDSDSLHFYETSEPL